MRSRSLLNGVWLGRNLMHASRLLASSTKFVCDMAEDTLPSLCFLWPVVNHQLSQPQPVMRGTHRPPWDQTHYSHHLPLPKTKEAKNITQTTFHHKITNIFLQPCLYLEQGKPIPVP